jgi:hypothetical protein
MRASPQRFCRNIGHSDVSAAEAIKQVLEILKSRNLALEGEVKLLRK